MTEEEIGAENMSISKFVSHFIELLNQWENIEVDLHFIEIDFILKLNQSQQQILEGGRFSKYF